MNDEAADSKGMKWALRLVAPFCLIMIIALAWHAHEVRENFLNHGAQAVITSPIQLIYIGWILDRDPMIYFLPSFALCAIAVWSMESDGIGLRWGASLGLAAVWGIAIVIASHVALHKVMYKNYSSPPPQNECPLCHGWIFTHPGKK